MNRKNETADYFKICEIFQNLVNAAKDSEIPEISKIIHGRENNNGIIMLLLNRKQLERARICTVFSLPSLYTVLSIAFIYSTRAAGDKAEE